MFPSKAFMPFTVLGDPDSETSTKIIRSMVDNGADCLELGFAFSDPIADGPIIQKANMRALKAGITTEKAFDILKEIRNYTEIPISLMLAYNIAYQYGVDSFYRRCNELKIDAVLIPDIPIEELHEINDQAEKNRIATPLLVSPNSKERAHKICNLASGYIYMVSILGTTGVRSEVIVALPRLCEELKTDLPIYVGFGISKPEHVKKVLTYADGAITGSAICRMIEENTIDKIGQFIKEMKDAARDS